jgi:hypothetical protein
MLSAVYIETKLVGEFSLLIGTSLALYMIGMVIGPIFVTVIPDFIFSFVEAVAILGLALVYLMVLVPLDSSDQEVSPTSRVQRAGESLHPGRILRLQAVNHFGREPVALLSGFAIFSFNATQAYLFPSIMVHAALNFGFTCTENGHIVSTAASTFPIYLLITFYIGPRAQNAIKRAFSSRSGCGGNSRQQATDLEECSKSRYHFKKNL